MHRGAPAPVWRPLAAGMRWLLVAAGVLVLLAGVQLFVFSERTDRYFAWTVQPPLTAASLGAAYWASALTELTAARARWWSHARIAVPGVLVFTALTLVVTLVHLDRFHLGSRFLPSTQAVTWAWLAIYAVVPLLLVVLWVRQARLPGDDPPRSAPLPRWLRALVVLQAAVLALAGAALLLAPERADWWPWSLTPLTARAIGAWAVGLAVVAGHATIENDAHRVRPAAWASLALPVLAGVALLRYPQDVDAGPALWAYLAYLLSALVVGAATLATGRRALRGAHR